MEQGFGMWPLLIWIGWMAFCIWFWRQSARTRQSRISEGWSEFARRTGLIFGSHGSTGLGLGLGSWRPEVSGAFRGHWLSLTLSSQKVEIYDSSVSLTYTTVSLQIVSRGGQSSRAAGGLVETPFAPPPTEARRASLMHGIMLRRPTLPPRTQTLGWRESS